MEKTTIDGVTTYKTQNWVYGKKGRRMRALSRLQQQHAELEVEADKFKKHIDKNLKGSERDMMMERYDYKLQNLARIEEEIATLKSRI